jgi:hypothetical protein
VCVQGRIGKNQVASDGMRNWRFKKRKLKIDVKNTRTLRGEVRTVSICCTVEREKRVHGARSNGGTCWPLELHKGRFCRARAVPVMGATLGSIISLPISSLLTSRQAKKLFDPVRLARTPSNPKRGTRKKRKDPYKISKK